MFLSAIVMACGKGERFGSNKLMAKLKGLLQWPAL